MGLFKAIFGTESSRKLKKIKPIIDKINSLEPSMQALSDKELSGKTAEFKDRLAKGETLDDLLPEAFAAVREAAVRTVGMRPYDVQMIGGVVLHQGRIAEMKTGEGKTLVAVMPAYLNALEGKGVYIVTVNDYLAQRDASWMGKIHKFMGLSVGCIVQDLNSAERKEAYACDITYGTNSQFGFDYLRDNMAIYKEALVQRDLHYAIVDEVDSILIDEARTPLIISGRGEESTDDYIRAERFVSRLERGEDIRKITKSEYMMGEEQPESGDYMVDLKAKTVALTQQGMEKAEHYYGVEDISAPELTELNHYIQQALKAHSLFTRDKEYVVIDGEVMIVDEFNGRIMHGRRYSDGLHQALEAKEGVKIKSEDKTIATITYQNYFRMFAKLAGMTGTAMTEEDEFRDIYYLDVVEIPTNKPMIREDLNDVVYTTEVGKFKAIADEIEKIHATGQPLLVGTVSVEKSEYLSNILKKRGVKHEVLNAKHHMREAEIVAQAGQYGHVTIATNMAGRGTDILLGGNPDYLAKRDLRNEGMSEEMIENATSHVDTDNEEILAARALYKQKYDEHKKVTDKEHDKVVEVGGLFIIGTERHESRRIDNQLRGRAGRQGDPGKTRFFISVKDELMQRFGAERISGLMARLSPDDNIPIEFGILTKQIEISQKRVEAYNFDIRKSVLEYDDVMNTMRATIYDQRRKVLMGNDITGDIQNMINETISARVNMYCVSGTKRSEWDIGGLESSINELCGFKPSCIASDDIEKPEEMLAQILDEAHVLYENKEKRFAELSEKLGSPDMREVERIILLRSVDRYWVDHIDAMDQLRQGVGLQAYGQKQPIIEYRNEGFDMFDEMIANIRETTVNNLFRVEISANTERKQVVKATRTNSGMAQGTGGGKGGTPRRNSAKKVGPNEPCPCGSGKKYKYCCMKKEEQNR